MLINLSAVDALYSDVNEDLMNPLQRDSFNAAVVACVLLKPCDSRDAFGIAEICNVTTGEPEYDQYITDVMWRWYEHISIELERYGFPGANIIPCKGLGWFKMAVDAADAKAVNDFIVGELGDYDD